MHQGEEHDMPFSILQRWLRPQRSNRGSMVQQRHRLVCYRMSPLQVKARRREASARKQIRALRNHVRRSINAAARPQFCNSISAAARSHQPASLAQHQHHHRSSTSAPERTYTHDTGHLDCTSVALARVHCKLEPKIGVYLGQSENI
ncbi:hypothetical protein GOP47_0023397 [Adiantum capillus-veneris]|uniref:Uncharacterized protein n=1 Tax=Adiantum capillus-veneris TaxID=13818 RepID=A0A9D4Z534_ADICA|nr:hypothetical protein GOP47_0023397 [Adiantum capillus-veneris]